MSFAEWINDLRWSANMRRARRWRRQLEFGEREKFDRALRPRFPLEPGSVIAYPDAIYHVTIDDLLRAMSASKGHTP